MSEGIFGIQNLAIEHAVNEATIINIRLAAYPGHDANYLWKENWRDMFPGDVLVKCGYCGQFGAVHLECRYCGHTIE